MRTLRRQRFRSTIKYRNLRGVVEFWSRLLTWRQHAVAAVAEQITLAHASYGRAHKAAETSAFIERYMKRRPNITIVYDRTMDIAKLRAQAQAANLTWNAVSLGSNFGLPSSDANDLERIDCSAVACSDLQMDRYPSTGHRVPWQIRAAALGFNKSLMPSGRTPQSWADAKSLSNVSQTLFEVPA